jgi:hypothetical protein
MLLDDVTDAYVKINNLLRHCTPEELQHLKTHDIPAEYRRRPRVDHVLDRCEELPDPAQCAAS